jgi:hypothetical protein
VIVESVPVDITSLANKLANQLGEDGVVQHIVEVRRHVVVVVSFNLSAFSEYTKKHLNFFSK